MNTFLRKLEEALEAPENDRDDSGIMYSHHANDKPCTDEDGNPYDPMLFLTLFNGEYRPQSNSQELNQMRNLVCTFYGFDVDSIIKQLTSYNCGNGPFRAIFGKSPGENIEIDSDTISELIDKLRQD